MNNQSLEDKALALLKLAINNDKANFREGQLLCIKSLVQQKSRLLVVQRTGWGKSIIYFIATRILRDQGAGITLLISPLLALMRNQIKGANRINIKAVTINSSNPEEWSKINQELLAGTIDILLISPERLANQEFRENILLPIAKKIGLFVVDEAHCISDWGHDFRPDYRRIVRILQALPSNIPVLATTATANNRVINDIKKQLGENLKTITGFLTRKSLQLQNINLPNIAERLAWLAEQIPNISGSGIIYTLTVKDCEKVTHWLKCQNINAKSYHSQLENDERELLENQLLNNEIKVLVATNALGMGFDKPDLAFVIHFQRPGSIIHYYQQVGRAGRSLEQAYGILLSGDEDEEITNYFIVNAFPPQAHTEEVLNALNQSENGLSVPQLEQELNLTRSQIDKVLKLLSLESPSPVVKHDSKWYSTPINYQIDLEKIAKITNIRYQEQAQMKNYMNSQECLMMFLAKALDDFSVKKCGKCAVCLGKPLLSETCSFEKINSAITFLKKSSQIIEPRKQWALKDALSNYNFSGNIKADLKIEKGRALCLWGDDGWGKLVKKGKYQDGYFDDNLVTGIYDMIQVWQPQSFPTWITCVPSLKRTNLVPNFAQRLADKLGLPFLPVVEKIKENKPQKTMSNSYQQAHNLDGVFQINHDIIKQEPVFLIDDFVDSRWTFTIIGALLRQAGTGKVFPIALALNSLS